MSVEAALRALAEPRRVAILQLARDEPRSVGDIAAHFDISLQAVSQHLQVLKDAGLLAGKRFTSHAGVLPELPASLVQERVVEDGHLVTSRGAATSVDFGLALVRRLCGVAAAQEVAKGIMA